MLLNHNLVLGEVVKQFSSTVDRMIHLYRTTGAITKNKSKYPFGKIGHSVLHYPKYRETLSPQVLAKSIPCSIFIQNLDNYIITEKAFNRKVHSGGQYIICPT